MGRTLPASVERRSAQRYAVDAILKYRLSQESGVLSGMGNLVNLSTTGVLFQTPEPPSIGTKIELFIPWPSARLRPMEVYIAGQVVRHRPGATAVAVEHYEFRVKERRTPTCYAECPGVQS